MLNRQIVVRVAVLTVLASLLATTPGISAQAQAPSGTQAASLAARWTAIAYTAFAVARAVPSDMSAEMLQEFIARGAVSAVSSGPVRRDEADANIKRFAEAMIKAGTRQGETIRMGENSFGAARGLCPLYPFC